MNKGLIIGIIVVVVLGIAIFFATKKDKKKDEVPTKTDYTPSEEAASASSDLISGMFDAGKQIATGIKQARDKKKSSKAVTV